MCNGNEKCEKCDKCFESNCGLCDRKIYARLHHIHDDLEDLTKLTKHSHMLWVESEELRLSQLMADKTLEAAQLAAASANVAANAAFETDQLNAKIKNVQANAAFVQGQLDPKAALDTKEVAELAKFKGKLGLCEKMHANIPKIRAEPCRKCGCHERCHKCHSCKKCECKCRGAPVIIRPEIIRTEIVRPEIVRPCDGDRCEGERCGEMQKLKAMLTGKGSKGGAAN